MYEGGLLNYTLLEGINNPEDLKKLSVEELPKLCDEIRECLIENVSKTGGHLASSLGVVELTVALHYIFDTPEDVIVWDVGHQGYAHKILTERKDRFHTLRQYGGISGFLKREESVYDAYGAGHASTALSAGFGIAVARDKKKEDFRVVSVFGDGALTGGLCYEAINNIGSSNVPKFLAILNDNNWSISENVGAINKYLNNFAQTTLYNRFRRRVREGLEKFPRIGKQMTFLARRIEEGARGILTSGALFEALGFDYIGPIDGHNLKELIRTLKNLKDTSHPVLLHITTKKGKGYPPAEKEPEDYHGVKPFCPEDGLIDTIPGVLLYQDVFGKELKNLAEIDERIVGITAAMPTGTGIIPFLKSYPERFYDVGIAEEHAVVFSAGLASRGLKPYVAIYSTFLQRSYDQIVHDVSLQKLPVVFCIDRAGLVGEDGPTHHGTFDLSYLIHIPNMIICAPKDGNELRNLMFSALKYDKGPFAIRYPKAEAIPYNEETKPEEIEIGKWEILKEGKDVAILAVGSMVSEAMKAATILKDCGIEVEVVNARFVKPLDIDYIKNRLFSFSKIVTVEENSIIGGFGSYIGIVLEELEMKIIKLSLGIPDRFITQGKRSILLDEIGLTGEKIAEKIVSFLRKSDSNLLKIHSK
jgi:1-deoxy-D-xylulose-5-phosphate synthase